jgi:hypothetical protein
MMPTEERDLLLRVVTQLAESRLNAGGLMPFGATLKPPRDVRILMPKSMKPDVTSEELDAFWVRQLRKAAAEADCKTVCSCAEVRYGVSPDQMASAILVHIEHADVYSANVLCPFRKDEGSRVIFGEPQLEESDFRVFVSAEDEPRTPAMN